VFTSIIIPTLNEEKIIDELLDSLTSLKGDFEIIIADGGSADRTVSLAQNRDLPVVEAPPGRGSQMNVGANIARGEVLLFLHADTRLPENALSEIEKCLSNYRICGGNFSLIFGGDSPEARLLTIIYPFLRLGGMCYGDSAIFVRRQTFVALAGYRDYPLFEDCDFYRRMKRCGKVIRLPLFAVTSSRRFEGRFIRTFALWSLLQILYWLGADPHLLNRLYQPIR